MCNKGNALNSEINDKVNNFHQKASEITGRLRDGIYDKPEGLENLLEYAQSVNSILLNGEVGKATIKEVLYFVDVTTTLLSYEDNAPWVREIVGQMDDTVLEGIKLKKEK